MVCGFLLWPVTPVFSAPHTLAALRKEDSSHPPARKLSGRVSPGIPSPQFKCLLAKKLWSRKGVPDMIEWVAERPETPQSP